MIDGVLDNDLKEISNHGDPPYGYTWRIRKAAPARGIEPTAARALKSWRLFVFYLPLFLVPSRNWKSSDSEVQLRLSALSGVEG